MKMITTYEISFKRQCPINGATDSYDAILEVGDFITVETIKEAIEKLPAKDFQENLTRILAEGLDCKVKTIGFHSGVKTTCECS